MVAFELAELVSGKAYSALPQKGKDAVDRGKAEMAIKYLNSVGHEAEADNIREKQRNGEL